MPLDIGAKGGNAVIPYSQTTRRTKKVAITFSNTPTGWTSINSWAIAYETSDLASELIVSYSI